MKETKSQLALALLAITAATGCSSTPKHYVVDAEADAQAHCPNLSIPAENEHLRPYYIKLCRQVQPKWTAEAWAMSDVLRLRPGQYSTDVEVVVDRNGEVKSVDLAKSSGVDQLDDLAIEVWEDREKVSPPPRMALNEGKEFRTRYNMSIGI